MKGKNWKEIDLAKVIIWLMRTFGVFALVALITVIIGGIDLSNSEMENVEVMHRVLAGKQEYPAEGIDYELEARVINRGVAIGKAARYSVSDGWYSDTIVANHGDTIEVRLKVTAANADDIDLDAISQRMLFKTSTGLKLLAPGVVHDKVILPGGALADYAEEAADERISYVTVGTFELNSSDWWSGRSSSVILPMNPEMMTKLEVIFPYCDVDILVVIALIIAAVVFGLVVPYLIKSGAFSEDKEANETLRLL